MPKGVAKEFLALVEADERGAKRQAVTMGAVAVLLLGPAYYLVPPWGLVSGAAGALVGAGVGLLGAQRRTRVFEDSLRGAWATWMRNAQAADTLGQLHRRVRGRNVRALPYLWAAVLTTVWAIEVLLLTLALRDTGSDAWSHAAAVANGLLAGAILGHAVRHWRWARAFRTSLRDMVRAGELGTWGVI